MAFSGVTFVNGQATVYLKDGESKVIAGLAQGTKITVTEQMESDHFTVLVNGTAVADRTFTHEITKDGASIHAHFVNEHLRGDLTVSKETVSPIAADATLPLTFHIDLDVPLNGTYGNVTFVNGKATVYLKDDQSVMATGIPVGINYTITEVPSADFVSTHTGNSNGTIATTASSVAYTNTRKLGNLAITKDVYGRTDADTTDFTFEIVLNPSYNGTFGGVEFVGGKATFTLKDGATQTITGMPMGTMYTITEVNYVATLYAPVYGTITGDVGPDTTETVTYVNQLLGSLTVSKTVVDEYPVADKSFTFTVTLSDTTINGTYGDMTFTNGVATFTLKGGESKTAVGLTPGINYTVEETADSGYITTSTGTTGKISSTAPAIAHFTNTRKTGELMVTKTVVGHSDPNAEFVFTVTLDNTAINGTFGDMTFENGVATVTLKGGESATAIGLPEGVVYTVTKTGDVGTIPANDTATAAFVNHREVVPEYGTLMVSKTVSGNAADVTRKFTFQIVLDAPVNGTYGDVTFADGIATFQLAHGETAVAQRLPAGIGYTVLELDFDDYIVTATNDTGVIPANSIRRVTFDNQRVEIDVPETGDRSTLWVYAALLIISAGLLALRSRKARKA